MHTHGANPPGRRSRSSAGLLPRPGRSGHCLPSTRVASPGARPMSVDYRQGTRERKPRPRNRAGQRPRTGAAQAFGSPWRCIGRACSPKCRRTRRMRREPQSGGPWECPKRDSGRSRSAQMPGAGGGGVGGRREPAAAGSTRRRSGGAGASGWRRRHARGAAGAACGAGAAGAGVGAVGLARARSPSITGV